MNVWYGNVRSRLFQRLDDDEKWRERNHSTEEMQHQTLTNRWRRQFERKNENGEEEESSSGEEERGVNNENGTNTNEENKFEIKWKMTRMTQTRERESDIKWPIKILLKF